jgi:DNA-binding FrmR family transcriptional regulator
MIRMIEEDRYCIDVLTQTQTVRAALVCVESQGLKVHMRHCIEGAIVSGNATEQRKNAAELLERAARLYRTCFGNAPFLSCIEPSPGFMVE